MDFQEKMEYAKSSKEKGNQFFKVYLSFPMSRSLFLFLLLAQKEVNYLDE